MKQLLSTRILKKEKYDYNEQPMNNKNKCYKRNRYKYTTEKYRDQNRENYQCYHTRHF